MKSELTENTVSQSKTPASIGGAIGHGELNGSSGVHDHQRLPPKFTRLQSQPFSKFS